MTTLLVPRLPLGVAIDVLNEWGSAPRHASLQPWHGYPGAGSPERRALDACWGDRTPRLTDVAVETAADHAYPAFAAPSGEEQAYRLNALMEHVQLTPRLAPAADGVFRGWHAREDTQLLAALAAALIDHLDARPEHPLGVCRSTDCADVFLDTSPRRNRSFCSPRCQTRERVRAHRGRRRPGA